MALSVQYTYTCDRCGAAGQTDDPHGMHGWLQLGISGSGEPSPFFCSWLCLLHVVADNMAPHSH